MSDGLYQQIEQHCNAEPIRDLLREIKDRSDAAKRDVLVSGTKGECISQLRRAVESNHAQQSEVIDLLRKTEETGQQHVLLLSPAPSTLAETPTLQRRDVESSLFSGGDTLSTFPRFEYPTSGYIWSDFRSGNGDGWLAKAYGLERYKASLGLARIEEGEDGRIEEVRQYEYRETKNVLIANWRSTANILELRIDSQGIQTSKTLDERRAAMWQLLKPAVGREDLVGVDVDQLLANLVFERKSESNRRLYLVSKVELTDPRSGLIRFLTFNSEEFDQEPGREQALEAMQKANFSPSLVRLEWKADADGAPDSMKENLAVVLEKTPNGPELRIHKRITSEVYEYVFNQLRNRLQSSA